MSPGPQDISTGDLVRVELEADIFKAMQEGHGGWSDPMLEVGGSVLYTSLVNFFVNIYHMYNFNSISPILCCSLCLDVVHSKLATWWSLSHFHRLFAT